MSIDGLVAGRSKRQRTRRRVTAGLGMAVGVVFVVSLMVGPTTYGPGEVARVVLGEDVPGASFTVGRLRLPRAVLAALSGAAFGMAGATFQSVLRNPLASPDVIGISSGASAAAVIGSATLGWDESRVSLLALIGALGTAWAMYLLANRGGFAGGRLVLTGIGIAALLKSVVAYVLARTAAWDLQAAMRWLTGSLNGATWDRVVPLAATGAVVGAALLLMGRDLAVLRLGDDAAAALGLSVPRTRTVLLAGAVVLLASATAAAGPIAFVAFMAGPIASRLVGPGASSVGPAGLVGAALVLGADLVGQHAVGHRYPVGVVTGVLGAPYLIALLGSQNRAGSLR